MMLTPRQITAYVEFSEQLDGIERTHALQIAVVGAQGNQKQIEETLKELNGSQVQS